MKEFKARVFLLYFVFAPLTHKFLSTSFRVVSSLPFRSVCLELSLVSSPFYCSYIFSSVHGQPNPTHLTPRHFTPSHVSWLHLTPYPILFSLKVSSDLLTPPSLSLVCLVSGNLISIYFSQLFDLYLISSPHLNSLHLISIYFSALHFSSHLFNSPHLTPRHPTLSPDFTSFYLKPLYLSPHYHSSTDFS